MKPSAGSGRALDVSVVIPTFNRSGSLHACLEALQKQTLSREAWQIIVVSDGSTDATSAVVADQAAAYGNVGLVSIAKSGPAAARNAGVAAAEGSLIAFTDDDCVPCPGWLDEIIAPLKGDSSVAGVGGRIVRYSDCTVSQYIDDAGYFMHRMRGGGWDYLVTANACYRRNILLELGGFSTKFAFAGGEDSHFGMRVVQSGYRLISVQDAVVRHRHPERMRQLVRMAHRYGRAQLLLRQILEMEARPTRLRLVMGTIRTEVSRYIRSRRRHGTRTPALVMCAVISNIGLWCGQHQQAKL